ncbi:MAG: fluoride efflux transporter CrcB [Gemmatimonadetes bacterium]|nr:MAG: fluoride efflux transporter CrcB [Gemmatimonadota bacterium]
MRWVWIAVGGALGAICRYVVSGLAHQLVPTTFPWGTLVVNLTGSFLIGFLWALFEELWLSPSLRLLIFTGFLGAFTTFSTFSLESTQLLRDNEIKLALINLIGSTVSGIMLVLVGFIFARFLLQLLR